MAINTFYSDLVLGKVKSLDEGFPFEEIEVTFAEGMEAGVLLKADGTVAAAADVADVVAVLVDRDFIGGRTDLEVGAKVVAVAAKRGLTLNQAFLKFSDVAINAAGITKLEDMGFKVTDKVF